MLRKGKLVFFDEFTVHLNLNEILKKLKNY
jgi:hypothetical protein